MAPMLRGVTRLTTPASLIQFDDNGNAMDVVDPRVYRGMHGYIPVPHSSHREIFDVAATKQQSRFVVELSAPAAFLDPADTLQVRIDLFSAAMATDDMLSSLAALGAKLFDGKLGEEICVSSAMVCGVGIECYAPDTVSVERLDLQDLVGQLCSELKSLLAAPKNASTNERAGYLIAARWLTNSLEPQMARREAHRINSVLDSLEDCQNRMANENEKKAIHDLLLELQH